MHDGQQLVSVGSKDFPVPPKAENGTDAKTPFYEGMGRWDACKVGEQKKDRKMMSGKYDPPDKARLIAANPSISSTCELMVATAEGKFPPKAKRNDSASRAGERCARNPAATPKRGRKPIVTPERV